MPRCEASREDFVLLRRANGTRLAVRKSSVQLIEDSSDHTGCYIGADFSGHYERVQLAAGFAEAVELFTGKSIVGEKANLSHWSRSQPSTETIFSQLGHRVDEPGGGLHFTIECRFSEEIPSQYHAVFEAAANRWTRAIRSESPKWVDEDGEAVSALRINVSRLVNGDGDGNVLARGAPDKFVDRTTHDEKLRVARGFIWVDLIDLKNQRILDWWLDIITHEIGHVLGLGTLWVPPYSAGLIDRSNVADIRFIGHNAVSAFHDLGGDLAEASVAVAEDACHWRETTFRREIMSPYLVGPGNPLSKISISALADLGYEVDVQVAEEYRLDQPATYLGIEENEDLIFRCALNPSDFSKVQ